jgi:electron transfer flavoprotein beta subunit
MYAFRPCQNNLPSTFYKHFFPVFSLHFFLNLQPQKQDYSMKILVCISQVPDTTTKIAFTDNDTKFNEDKVQYIVNPYDEWYALVRALEIKETSGGNVSIITVGPASVDAIIRKALAIGADDAVRIDMNPSDAWSVAKAIADYARGKGFDLILAGKETIDYNGSEVPGMLAALLDQPYIALASKLDIENNAIRCEVEVDGGIYIMRTALPAVVSAAKGMAEARIPNMRGIMAARTKNIEVVSAAVQPLVGTKKFALPNPKSAVKLIDPENMDQLVELLHNEAKVI